MNKEFIRYKIFTFINLGAAFLFSVLNISFHADISVFSFLICAIYLTITIFFSLKMIFKTNGKYFMTVIKLTEYLPYVFLICFILRRAGSFGTPFIIDVFTVILWFIVFFFSYFTSKSLYPKKNKKITDNWNVKPVEKQYKGIFKLFYEIIDWIDALVWAVFTVLIFQIFLMQLYEIPSESMVPTFLIKDRVFVSKIDCGPKFPLTEVGLPNIRKYKRGDTIVLRNPHYSLDRKSEVKTVVSNLIYMLTFMTVNLNKDDFGELKADPLVKRITGLPGEQLVMQDGTLYVRTKNSDEFIPSKIDEKYATWNLNSLNPKYKNQVRSFPFNNEEYQKLLDLEEERRNLNLQNAEFEALNIVNEIKNYQSQNKLTSFTSPSLFEYDLFNDAMNLSIKICNQENGIEWFTDFMTSWIGNKQNIRDMYEESNFRLNVMTKLTLGKIILQYAKLMNTQVESSLWSNDSELKLLFEKAQILHWYIQGLLDERNMPLFPANDENQNPQYIPKDCYFMMGDNRFNSLDLRHSYEQKIKPLTNGDDFSVQYYSMMSPQFINKKYIIGKPIFRFWPLNRFGGV